MDDNHTGGILQSQGERDRQASGFCENSSVTGDARYIKRPASAPSPRSGSCWKERSRRMPRSSSPPSKRCWKCSRCPGSGPGSFWRVRPGRSRTTSRRSTISPASPGATRSTSPSSSRCGTIEQYDPNPRNHEGQSMKNLKPVSGSTDCLAQEATTSNFVSTSDLGENFDEVSRRVETGGERIEIRRERESDRRSRAVVRSERIGSTGRPAG